jgi:molecular chaperone HscB
MLKRSLFISSQLIRKYTTKVANVDYFTLFPKSFPQGMNSAHNGFKVDLKLLRKEYRNLQSLNHPDLIKVDDDNSKSSIINKAYEILQDPLKRAQYILLLHAGIDLSNDEIGKSLQFQDKSMLFEMMEIHERLENIINENELNEMKTDNNEHIKKLIIELDELFKQGEWDKAALNTIRLKYCYNIKNALKEWEAGKPITLTH